MNKQEQYEYKTGERATYRKASSDYHTLRYVRWLEAEAEAQDARAQRAEAEVARLQGLLWETEYERSDEAVQRAAKEAT